MNAYERRGHLAQLVAEQLPGWGAPPDVVASLADLLAPLVAERILATLYERVYPVPAGMEHEADCLRLMHADLAAMSDLRLTDDRDRLRLRLFLEPNPHPWLVERLRAIESERSARKGHER